MDARPRAGPGRRRVAEQPGAPRGGQRHVGHEGRGERRPQRLDPRRLVGRGLRRHERLGHRQRRDGRPAARPRTGSTRRRSTACSTTRWSPSSSTATPTACPAAGSTACAAASRRSRRSSTRGAWSRSTATRRTSGSRRPRSPWRRATTPPRSTQRPARGACAAPSPRCASRASTAALRRTDASRRPRWSPSARSRPRTWRWKLVARDAGGAGGRVVARMDAEGGRDGARQRYRATTRAEGGGRPGLAVRVRARADGPFDGSLADLVVWA